MSSGERWITLNCGLAGGSDEAIRYAVARCRDQLTDPPPRSRREIVLEGRNQPPRTELLRPGPNPAPANPLEPWRAAWVVHNFKSDPNLSDRCETIFACADSRCGATAGYPGPLKGACDGHRFAGQPRAGRWQVYRLESVDRVEGQLRRNLRDHNGLERETAEKILAGTDVPPEAEWIATHDPGDATFVVAVDPSDGDPLRGEREVVVAFRRCGLRPRWYGTPCYWIRWVHEDTAWVPTAADAGDYFLFHPPPAGSDTGFTWNWDTESRDLPELVVRPICWADVRSRDFTSEALSEPSADS